MRQWMRVLAAMLATITTAAAAADRPVAGPVPDWVQPAPTEVAPGPTTDAAIQVLLNDQQVRFSPTATEIYSDNRIRIQTPQGLQSMGTIALTWQPDADVITVHRLIVRRGTQVRELLGSGQDFTVLRREDMLEQATLTGLLTAVLQPPDLQVGDIVEFAYTRRHADPVVPDKPDLQFAWFNSPVQSVRFRASWPGQMAVRWQLRDFKPELQESSAGGNQSIAFTLANPPPLLQPTGAPMRHAAIRRVDLSAFQSWPEVSRRLAPLYTDAARLAADSPLRAEIERIRTASSDPKERAAAALRITQEQVRYVLLAMNAGALVPATADQTWQRRYGDCKAKTALLLALLRGLGIEAEPVAVHTNMGDGIDRLLPAISAFDHVLVRATIAGKVYWLDGTRRADRQLDRLQIPAFHWGLPLNARGSDLVRIEPAPLAEPQMVQDVSIDASAGVDAPAPFEAKVVFRGDAALGLKLSLDNTDATQRDQGLRAFWRNRIDDLQISKVTTTYDESAGTLTWTAAGTLQMDLDDNDYYEIDGMYLGFKPDFTRPEGTDVEAPYAVSYPEYLVNRVRVKLPPGKPEFTIYGENIDTTLAGWEYRRRARIENGVFTAESLSRSLVPEVSAKEALAAEASLRGMYRDGLYIQKPDKPVAQSAPTAGELREQAGKPLASANEYVRRGAQMLIAGLPDQAIADFSRAIAMDPGLNSAYVSRGMAHENLDKLEEARSDYETAVRLVPRHTVALRALAALSLRQKRYGEVIELMSAALEVEDNASQRRMRASAHEASNQLELALADHEAIARLNPADTINFLTRAGLLIRLQRPEAARTLATEVLAAHGGTAEGIASAAGIYSNTGDKDKARSLYTEAISMAPTANLYTSRALLSLSDPESAAADLALALKLDPLIFDLTLQLLVEWEVRDKKNSAVLPVLERLDFATAGNISVRLTRGEALALTGQVAAAKEVFASARELATQSTHFNSLCWRQATSGVLLEDALQDCGTALAGEPKSAAFLDSRGLALLKLGRLEECIASYDAAIAANPKQATSLFGRGIAKLRLGKQVEGEADITAARDITSSIEQRFVTYGVKR